MIHAWVLGSGGMLGSAINRQLELQGIAVYRYSEKFDWTNIERLRIQFRIALEEFTDGVGAMNSKADELRSETLALEELLRLLQQKLLLLKFPGLVGFASSAGAFYSSCDDFKINELSTVTAQTDYAKAKLAQEQMLIRFLSKVNGVRLLLARFSTLYGPGQSFGKQQGLLSHIARCALRQQSIEIFVPLDTLRDYMFSDDAAINFIRSLRLLCIEIIASEQSITISQIISTFSKLIQKHLRLIFSRNHLTNLYAARISYQSIYRHNTDSGQRRQYTLAEGINSVLMAERIDYLNSAGSGLVTPPKS
jgi:UDP-glucose 4-epimerase